MNEIVYAGLQPVVEPIGFHSHDSWEVIYCMEGTNEVSLTSSTLSYQASQVVLVPSGHSHRHGSSHGAQIFLNIQQPNLNASGPLVLNAPSPVMRSAFEAAMLHFQETSLDRGVLLNAYGTIISSYITRLIKPTRSDIVEEILHNIQTHASNPNYKLNEFLQALPFSYDHVRKLFQKEMGMTPHQYLSDLRLDMARHLLTSSTTLSISDAAHMCGYQEPLYFSRMFKKKYGVSPIHYQKTT